MMVKDRMDTKTETGTEIKEARMFARWNEAAAKVV